MHIWFYHPWLFLAGALIVGLVLVMASAIRVSSEISSHEDGSDSSSSTSRKRSSVALKLGPVQLALLPDDSYESDSAPLRTGKPSGSAKDRRLARRRAA